MALGIAPSRHWMGNDGPWSTFNIKVGSQAELLEVLPASSLSLTLVVLPQGCPQDEQQANCNASRGNILDPQDVSSWDPLIADNGKPYLSLALPGEQVLLSEPVIGEISVNTLGLQWLGANSSADAMPLANQLIAGYATKAPFLGLLGLSGLPAYPVTPNVSYNSTLQTLKSRSSISGLTWAYTAGAKYKTPESFGSLTLGGYDSSLVNMDEALSGVNFTRNFNGNELTLTVKAVKVGDKLSESVGTGLVAQLDSMLPDIWLPYDICVLFEEAFHLQWNESVGMYMVTDEQRDRLHDENTSVAFELASDSTSGKLVSITLPYAAFDREVKFPLANITDDQTVLYYFPLKRTPNTTTNFNIFLGRTFFQEAYISADYEQQTFNVGQTLFPRDPQTNLIPIYPSETTPPVITPTIIPKPSSLNAGTIAGIALGVFILLSLLLGLAWWLRRRHKLNRLTKAAEAFTTRTASVDEITLATLNPDPSLIQNEYYKPNAQQPPSELPDPTSPFSQFRKHELDANATATNPLGAQLERHELEAGSVNLSNNVHSNSHSRPGPGAHQRDLSFGSSMSGVSPMGVGVGQRLSDAFGEPSPPMALSSGHPSPPLSDRDRGSGGGTFERVEMP